MIDERQHMEMTARNVTDIAVVKNKMENFQESMREIKASIEHLSEEVKKGFEETRECINELKTEFAVQKDEQKLIKKIVFGAVGVILLEVLYLFLKNVGLFH